MRHLVPAASLLVALHLEQVLSFHTIPSIRTRAANLRAQHLNQNDTPFIEALLRASRKVKTSFFFPGHQLGRGTPSVLDHNVMCGKSTEILKYDLPEDIEDIDCLSFPEGPIKHAQDLASSLFGARSTFFLCNGSTVGILASVFASMQLFKRSRRTMSERPPVVILPRNCHKSSIQALIISGAQPVFLNPELDTTFDVHHGFNMEDLEEALAANEGNVAAVLMLSPTYYGSILDVRAVQQRLRQEECWIPLIVDEAHGSHLRFLADAGHLPPCDGLSSGADLVVQSIHKTLTSLTQSSLLHVGGAEGRSGDREDLTRAIAVALDMLQSSSPSSLLLASLDATRWQFGSEGGGGREKLTAVSQLSNRTRRAIRRLKHFKLLEQEHRIQTCIALDPLRLTLLTPHGLSAEDAAELLESRHGVYVEISEGRLLTAALGIASTAQDCAKLVRGLRVLDQQASSSHREREERAGMVAEEEEVGVEGSFIPVTPAMSTKPSLTPREVYFAAVEEISVDNSAGRTSAETLVTYPPGIPILFPGEIITQPAVAALKRARIDKVRVCKIGL